jgi:hypothetical protein
MEPVETSAVVARAAAAEFQQRKADLEASIAARREAYISLFGDPNAHLIQQQTDAATVAAAAAAAAAAATAPTAATAGAGATGTRSSRSSRKQEVIACDDDMDTSDAAVEALIAEQKAAQQREQHAAQQLLLQYPGPSDADIAKGLFCLIDAHWLKQWVVGQALALPVPKKPAAAKRARSNSTSAAVTTTTSSTTAGDGAAPMEVVDIEDSDTEAANVAAVQATAAAAAAAAAAAIATAAAGASSPAVVHTVDDNSGAESDGGAAAIAAVAAAESGSSAGSSSSSAAAAGEVFKEPLQHAQHLCEHGAVHPAAITKFKLVTELVYSMLASVSTTVSVTF